MPSTRIDNFRPEDWLPYWLSVDELIAGLAALAVLVAFVAVWHALRGREAFDRRFARIALQREGLREAVLGARPAPSSTTAAGLMNAVVMRLNLLRSQHAQAARSLLARAGIRSNEGMVRYFFARLSMPFVFGLGILGDASGPQLLPIPENLSYARRARRRRARVLRTGHLPEKPCPETLAPDRAGIAGLARSARDLRRSRSQPRCGAAAGVARARNDLARAQRGIGDHRGRADLSTRAQRAFENLNMRTNMAAIRGVVNTLLQTAKFGTPLAQSLRVLAAEIREARMTRAEEKAARLPALLTVPMILFILPTLFIVVLGPAVLGMLDTFSGRGATSRSRSRRRCGRSCRRTLPTADGCRQLRAREAGQDRRASRRYRPRPASRRFRPWCAPAISSRSMSMPAPCATVRSSGLPSCQPELRMTRRRRSGPIVIAPIGFACRCRPPRRDRTKCGSIMCRRPARNRGSGRPALTVAVVDS